MAESLTPIASLANNSMVTVIAAVNAIINTISTTVITANGSANGAVTIGNGYVSGIFGAAVMVPGALRGGSVQTPDVLVIVSNTTIGNASMLTVGNTTVNTVVNSTSVKSPTANFGNAQVAYFNQGFLGFGNANVATFDYTASNNSLQILDTWPLATYRTVDYTIQVKDNAANNYQSSKISLIHDGGNPYFTEYALLVSNTLIATYSVSTNATSMIVQVTPTSSNTLFRILRTALNS